MGAIKKSKDEPSSSSSSRLVAIDLLRGFAALCVVVTHLPFSWTGGASDLGASVTTTTGALPTWITSITTYGSYGVNLFLVISGFCIHMQWARRSSGTSDQGGDRSDRGDRDEVSFFDFWKRRLRRLYPPYFAALVCSLAGLAVVVRLSGGGGGASTGVLAGMFGYPSDTQLIIDLVLLVLLAQNLNGASARVGNGPFWSLALEEQLYILYFPFLAVRRRWGWTPALILVMVVTFGWRAVFAFDFSGAPGFWYVVGPARWLEWVLGALAVEAYLGRIELSRWLRSPITLFVAAIASVLLMPPFVATNVRPWNVPGAGAINDVLFSFTGFVLINWFCHLDRVGALKRGRIVPFIAQLFAKVGLFSYSLYLVHNPVMVVVKRLAISVGIHNVVAVLLLRFGSAILAGYIFFRLVESFFLTKSRPLIPASPPAKRDEDDDPAPGRLAS